MKLFLTSRDGSVHALRGDAGALAGGQRGRCLVITVRRGYRTPANGCLAQAGDGLCPYPATYQVTIRTVEASYDGFVCGAHELVLAGEGRLAGSTPIGGK